MAMFMPWQTGMMGSACGCQPQMGGPVQMGQPQMGRPMQMGQPQMARPTQMGRPMRPMVPIGQMPLIAVPTGGFPVPESISPDQFPPAVKASIMRNLEGPPKPAVTPHVMEQAQSSMIAPDLPFKADVKGTISG
ncbi:MAG TPA: hypothetical protein VD973_06955 [Symbiobacteriaceae bacterium]|nr:hypothetical protein [Symbiobacteriaceae bacterium]